MSDTHLEFIKDYKDTPDVGSGNILLLSGDILVAKHLNNVTNYGSLIPYDKKTELHQEIYGRFLKTCSENYDRVFYVLGNHEYYGSDISYVNNWFPEYINSEYKNILVLTESCVEINNKWWLVGSTLWTDYDGEDPLAMVNAQQSLNDFRKITFNNSKLTPNIVVNENIRGINYIKKIVGKNPDKNIIVMTHHSPSKRSISKFYASSKINSAYTNDYDKFIENSPNIKYWVHGHTHFKFDYYIGNCRVLCNPHGYFSYENTSAFSVQSLDITIDK